MSSNVRAFPQQQIMPPQPSQQDWVWDGSNWCPPPSGGCWPTPPPCPPAGFPTPCPPWFPPPAGQAPWYPGANGGVSFSATPPLNPIRGNLWWDGTMLHLFDGAAWVNIGPPAPGSTPAGVTDGSNAAPGQVGEFLLGRSTFPFLATPNVTTGTITPLVVQPGDWDIWGVMDSGGVAVTGVSFVLAPVPVGMLDPVAAAFFAGTSSEGIIINGLGRGNFTVATALTFNLVVSQENTGGAAGTSNFRCSCRRRR